MRLLILLSSLTPVFSYSTADCRTDNGHEHWMCTFMDDHNRTYEHKEEFLTRKELVSQRRHKAASTIPENMGMTDMIDQTFHANHWLSQPLQTKTSPKHLHLTQYKLPSSLDLRDKLQPIKNQGACGSCYTFAAVAVLEYYAGQALSEQKLMDCTSSDNGPSYGCNGGWSETLFDYATHYPVVAAADQPYTAANAACNATCSDSLVKVSSFATLDHHKDAESEQRIPYMLNTFGPVVVAIDVGTTELLMSYNKGIFPGIACGSALDHAVTIVGYTPEYWIVRNSWGSRWGVNGYFHLERGVNACGVASYISYISKVD